MFKLVFRWSILILNISNSYTESYYMLFLVSDLIMTSDSEQMYMLSSVNVTNHAHKTKTSKNYRTHSEKIKRISFQYTCYQTIQNIYNWYGNYSGKPGKTKRSVKSHEHM